jgi:hypothetical protein
MTRMTRLAVPALMAIVGLVAASPAAAKTISIASDVSVTPKERALVFGLHVTNSGDEVAQGVVARLEFGGRQAPAGEARPLRPGERLEATLELPWTGGRGQWPLATFVDYADANGYPFQALSVALVSLGNLPPALVPVIKVTGGSLATSGEVRALVKNLSAVPRRVQVRFHAARGIEIAEPVQVVLLEAWADGAVASSVLNRSALPGSRLPVFATAEYDDADGHHAALGHDTLEIRPPRRIGARYAFALVALIMVVWLAVVAWRKWGSPATR